MNANKREWFICAPAAHYTLINSFALTCMDALILRAQDAQEQLFAYISVHLRRSFAFLHMRIKKAASFRIRLFSIDYD